MVRDLFTDEHRWFRETVAAFVAREIRPHRGRFREQRSIDREVWLAAGEQGLLGLGVPAEYGGSGVDDFRFNAILNEELGSVALAYGSCFGIHVDVVVPYLVKLGDEEQKRRWLPRACSGEITTAIGMTEPEAGSDLKALRTNARRDGDDWIVNGSKSFITNGSSADLILAAVRTEEGISLFAIEEGMAGFSRGSKLKKVGQPESDTAELFFEEVRVPSANVVGELGRGFAYMMENLPQERLSSACLNVAHAEVALEQTLEYAKERRAFGRPIGSFQHNRFALAEMRTEIDVARAFVDRCLVSHVRGELSAIDAAKAKWWSAAIQNRVLDSCVQLFGGYGYMLEYEVAQAWTDARVTRIWAGSNEIMKEIIGRSLGLGDPR